MGLGFVRYPLDLDTRAIAIALIVRTSVLILYIIHFKLTRHEPCLLHRKRKQKLHAENNFDWTLRTPSINITEHSGPAARARWCICTCVGVCGEQIRQRPSRTHAHVNKNPLPIYYMCCAQV